MNDRTTRRHDETVADIVGVMMREVFHRNGKDDPSVVRIVRGYAARIDMAYHREMDKLKKELKKAMMLNEAFAAANPGVGVGVVTIEDRPPVGNTTRLREALLQMLAEFDRISVRLGSTRLCRILDDAQAALAAPARNCDRFATVEEAMDAFHYHGGCPGDCGDCAYNDPAEYDEKIHCDERWLFDTYAPVMQGENREEGTP